mgnify:CR=1 FL=1
MGTQKSVLVCLAHGSEETEAVTVIDLLVRAGIQVTTASVESQGDLLITCSRGVRLQCDTTLVSVADQPFDALVLPGGQQGAETFGDSVLLLETLRQYRTTDRIVAAICAAPALVLAAHELFPDGNMTGFPGLRESIPEKQWIERRVVWDPRVNLLTSQAPGTTFYFALKPFHPLAGTFTARALAEPLVLVPVHHTVPES